MGPNFDEHICPNLNIIVKFFCLLFIFKHIDKEYMTHDFLNLTYFFVKSFGIL
jgi:hypothetical protein